MHIESTSSRSGYFCPAIALVAWTACALTLISFGGMAAHNSEYPENQINPKWTKAMLDTAKVTAEIGGGMLIPATAQTFYRAMTDGWNAVKNSITSIGNEDGMIANTVLAIVGGPALGLYAAFQAVTNNNNNDNSALLG